MGVSGVSGYGLFAGEDVKAGDLLGEYKGEIISNQEFERRGCGPTLVLRASSADDMLFQRA